MKMHTAKVECKNHDSKALDYFSDYIGRYLHFKYFTCVTGKSTSGFALGRRVCTERMHANDRRVFIHYLCHLQVKVPSTPLTF